MCLQYVNPFRRLTFLGNNLPLTVTDAHELGLGIDILSTLVASSQEKSLFDCFDSDCKGGWVDCGNMIQPTGFQRSTITIGKGILF